MSSSQPAFSRTLVAQAAPRNGCRPAVRIPALDGLRGIAILAVLLFHFGPRAGAFAWVNYAGRLGWMGVDLFFVLSGFLITGILLDAKGSAHYYRNFIFRRAARIFPLYYVCLAIYVVVTVFNGQSLTGQDNPAWFATYVGNIPQAVLNEAPRFTFFRPLWSLQIEEQFYLFYPAVIAVCSVRRLRTVLWGCVAAAFALRVSSLVFFGENARLACYVLMPSRMDALAIGGLLAITARTSGFSPGRSWAMLATGFASCVLLLHYRAPSFRDGGMRSIGFTVIAFTAGALLRVALCKQASPLGMVLCWSPLRYVGRIAYGMYLLQEPAHDAANWVFSRWFRVPSGSSMDFIITLIATIAAASFSWFAFESLTQRRVHAILMTRKN